MKEMNIYSVITAAGRSRRMKGAISGNKVYEKINDKSILSYSIEKFINFKYPIKGLILVTAPAETEFCSALADEILCGCVAKPHSFFLKSIPGGPERTDSVYNGVKAVLNEMPDGDSLIFIHDGARPAFSEEIAAEMIEELTINKDFDGITMAAPSYDTLCRVSDGFEIEGYEDRQKIYRVATPQLFRLNVLYDCFQKALKKPELKAKLTDETTLLKYFGKRVKITESNTQNIKITTPDDLEYMKKLLS